MNNYIELSIHSRLIKPLSIVCLGLILFVFSHLIFDIVSQGLPGLSLTWFTELPHNAGREGGISSILISTILSVGICLFFSVPIALISAIFLSECVKPEKPFFRLIYNAIDLLASVPSIVFGLFGYSFFVIYLQMGFSILAGGLTLAIMVLPLLIRLFHDCLRNLNSDFRINGFSQGLSLWSIYYRVLLPIAKKGLLTAIILSVARAVSETAALIFTAGYVYRMPESLLDSGRTLSVHILDLAMNVPGGNQNSYTSALTLLIFLLVINLSVLAFTRTRYKEPEIIP